MSFTHYDTFVTYWEIHPYPSYFFNGLPSRKCCRFSRRILSVRRPDPVSSAEICVVSMILRWGRIRLSFGNASMRTTSKYACARAPFFNASKEAYSSSNPPRSTSIAKLPRSVFAKIPYLAFPRRLARVLNSKKNRTQNEVEMSKNEKTSKKIAAIAAKGLKSPEKLTKAEIKALAASALTQAPDKKKPAKKTASKKDAAKKPAPKKVTAKKPAAKKAPAKKKATSKPKKK